MLEIHKGVGVPKLLAELLAADDNTRLLQQSNKHLHRLVLKFQLDAGLAQFAGLKVNLKNAETQDVGDGSRSFHGEFPYGNLSWRLAHRICAVNFADLS